jgi:hypothetical protein
MINAETINSKLKKLDNIFIVLLSVQIFLVITSLFIITNQAADFSHYFSNQIRIIIMITTLSAMIILRVYYNTSIMKIRDTENVEKQIEGFFNININRMAILETISLINLITFLITYQYVFIVISGILFILFMIYRPTEKVFNLELISKK